MFDLLTDRIEARDFRRHQARTEDRWMSRVLHKLCPLCAARHEPGAACKRLGEAERPEVHTLGEPQFRDQTGTARTKCAKRMRLIDNEYAVPALFQLNHFAKGRHSSARRVHSIDNDESRPILPDLTFQRAHAVVHESMHLRARDLRAFVQRHVREHVDVDRRARRDHSLQKPRVGRPT